MGGVSAETEDDDGYRVVARVEASGDVQIERGWASSGTRTIGAGRWDGLWIVGCELGPGLVERLSAALRADARP